MNCSIGSSKQYFSLVVTYLTQAPMALNDKWLWAGVIN